MDEAQKVTKVSLNEKIQDNKITSPNEIFWVVIQ